MKFQNMKTRKKYIFITITLLLAITIIFSIWYNNDSSTKQVSNKVRITGTLNLSEYTGYDVCLNYKINIDETKGISSIDVNVSYNSMTVITACLYSDITGSAKLKIPLFSSKVYTMNLRKYIPTIIGYVINKKPNPIIIGTFFGSITDISFDECDISEPKGSLKELTSDDINMFYNKFKRSFLS